MSASQVAQVVAQAKINLALRVLAREEGGYHQLETVFCRVALGDVVTVRATGGERSLSVHGPMLPAGGLGAPESNLAWRAADAYARRAGWPSGFTIDIDKRIPVGAGLGGGSADAGGVLRALNALSDAPLELSALLAVAASVGADIPFLTQDQAVLALAWGRGERLLPLPALPGRLCWLFCPDLPVWTADAYAWLDEQPPRHSAALISPHGVSNWGGIAEMAHNDFELAVCGRYPAIGALLAFLRSEEARMLVGPRPVVQLCGSGSAVFAVAADWGDEAGINFRWRSDEPGFHVALTRTAERVEPVTLTE